MAASEVEVDCLTGDAKVLRADILMDIGASINPAIDIGQIEGAFVQVSVSPRDFDEPAALRNALAG